MAGKVFWVWKNQSTSLAEEFKLGGALAMKVLHICNLPLPEDHPDYGRLRCHPGRWVLNLALAQKAQTGMQPELLVQMPGASADFSKEIEGIPVHFLAAPDRLRSATFFYFDARRVAARVRSLAPDIVHAHGTEDCHLLAAQRSGLPYLLTAQGLFFLINALSPPRRISREGIVEWTERIALGRARHVIAKSDYVGEALGRQFPHLQLHRIPNTFDPRLGEFSLEKESRLLVFIGTPVHRKGLDLLVQAIPEVEKIFPDVRLWIFGDSPHPQTDYEVRMKADLTALMGERVKFYGTIPAVEMAEQLAKATALIAPSREEMFGNQLIESLLVGTHGVVTEGTALAENVRRFGNGTVVPQEDAGGLAGAIIEVLGRTDFSEQASARQRVFEQIGPGVVAKEHELLYEKILAEG